MNVKSHLYMRTGNFSKSGLAILLTVLICAMASPAARADISVDGIAGGAEWYDTAIIPLLRSGENGYNGVDNARLRYAVTDDAMGVFLLCLGQAPGATDGSALGIVFYLGGREIAAYRQQEGAGYEAENYFCEGAMSVAKRSDGVYNPEGDFTIELRLGCKSRTAFAALEALVVRILDPLGEPSRDFAASIFLPEPETTVPTTERTTTTKETTTKETTTKLTTTKETTTAKTTTTKATTAKATTAKVTTTKPAVTAAATLPATTTAPFQSATTTATAPPTLPAATTQPMTAATATTRPDVAARQYPYQAVAAAPPTDAPWEEETIPAEEPPPDRPMETLWDYPARTPPATFDALSDAQGQMRAHEEEAASPRRPVLIALGILLLLAALAMALLWLGANGFFRKKDGEDWKITKKLRQLALAIALRIVYNT